MVTEVDKNGQPLVKFFYNDRNHRIRKESYENGLLMATTYYVRDVAGSVMAIYSDISGEMELAEQPIYGAGRIGVAYTANNSKTYVYELTDHLGNVRAVFTKNNNDATLEGNTDYYPFGMPMPNRNLEDANGYRYGFQGQYAEEDKETGLNAFELRMYDSRIGRWTSPDPYGQFHSPYIGMGNNPISYADPDGGCVGSDCPDKVTYGQNDCQCSTFDMETGIATTHFSNTNEIMSFISTPTADWSNPFTSFNMIDADPNQIQDKMKEYEPNFFGRIEDNLNNSNSPLSFVGSMAYNMVDDVYAFGTGFSLISPNGPMHLNGNLITRGSSEAIDTGINGMLTLATLGRVKKPTMNMGQFNAKYKGVLTKTVTSSKIKGVILKTMNRINKYWGKQVVAPNIKTAKAVSEGANEFVNDN